MKKELLFLLSLFFAVCTQAQIANQPTPLSLCDDGIIDEIAEFDLSVKNPEILGGQSASDYSVSYYLTQIDSDTEMNPLPTFFTNTLNPQTLFVRVEDIASGSYDTTTLTLRVNPNPAPGVPSVLSLCDDNSNDGIAVFDLTINDLIIINGELDISVSYYTSQSDAVFGSNAIGNPSIFANTTLPQTIYARLENEITGCFTITDFVIYVNPNPIAPNLEDNYEFCQGESIVIDSGVDPNEYTIQWEKNGFQMPGETSPTLLVTEEDIYSLILNNNSTGCFSITNTNVDEISCVDTDSDGVIDSVEDLNNNGNLDDDDTDLDMIPNYMDDDDDGDNVDTIIEINIPSGRMPNHPFVDTDMDLIENYLDDDDDGDLVLTIDEDYNNNGDPTDDDTNMNSIPDYLESAVALSVSEFDFNGFSMFPNPAKVVLNIELNNITNATLSIYDIQGKLIVEQSVSQEQNLELNVSDLQSGMYFVKLNTGTKELVKKLIIE